MTVSLATMRLEYNMWDQPAQSVCYSNWFSANGKNLTPLSLNDCSVCESLFTSAPTSTSANLPNNRKVVLVNVTDGESNSFTTMKIRQPGIFQNDLQLVRGYPEYTIDGENQENQLGPLEHVVFVIHGIGEAMWSKTENSMPSLITQANKLRLDIHKKLLTNCSPSSPPPARIEVLPILWYSTIHNASNDLMRTLNAVTLKSIPMLRSIANDVIIDVLMYQEPVFCATVLEFVTNKCNELWQMLRAKNASFDGEQVSICGHSLGSVIAWDILSLSDGNTNELSPKILNPEKIKLAFKPKCLFLMGSPVGLFLTLRNAHGAMNDFQFSSFPDLRTFNVINFSDPVSYR